MKNKSFQCFFISSQDSIQENFKINIQKHFIINLFFTNFTFKLICESEKTLTIVCSFSSQKSSTLFAISKIFVTNVIIFLHFVLFKNSYFSITMFKITSKNVEIISISFTKIAKITKIVEKSIANIRIQIVHIRVKIKIERIIFQISTFEFASKSIKFFLIQQIVCFRICKRCKQNFNFNNKFYEHIRQHLVRKSIQKFDFRIFTSKFTCKIKKNQ